MVAQSDAIEVLLPILDDMTATLGDRILLLCPITEVVEELVPIIHTQPRLWPILLLQKVVHYNINCNWITMVKPSLIHITRIVDTMEGVTPEVALLAVIFRTK